MVALRINAPPELLSSLKYGFATLQSEAYLMPTDIGSDKAHGDLTSVFILGDDCTVLVRDCGTLVRHGPNCINKTISAQLWNTDTIVTVLVLPN